MEELFFVLIQNAIQAAPAGKKSILRVDGRREKGMQVLEFNDDCGGISAEDIKHVFDPVFTTKSAQEGPGLGLYIAEQIATRHEGRIQMDSDFGHGSKFTVELRLPAAPGQTVG